MLTAARRRLAVQESAVLQCVLPVQAVQLAACSPVTAAAAGRHTQLLRHASVTHTYVTHIRLHADSNFTVHLSVCTRASMHCRALLIVSTLTSRITSSTVSQHHSRLYHSHTHSLCSQACPLFGTHPFALCTMHNTAC